MSEPQIDLKALLVEHEDCDAGTVQKLRNGLAQGGASTAPPRSDRARSRSGSKAATGNPKKLHLKLGIAYFFLGYMASRREPPAGRRALAAFYLGRGPRRAPASSTRRSRRSRRPRSSATPPARSSCSGPASICSKGELSKAREYLGDAKKEGSKATTPSTTSSSASLLPGRGRQLTGDQASGTGRRARSRATPAPCSSSATPTTWPATTTRRSATTSAA